MLMVFPESYCPTIRVAYESKDITLEGVTRSYQFGIQLARKE
jgi:hypothetical protein